MHLNDLMRMMYENATDIREILEDIKVAALAGERHVIYTKEELPPLKVSELRKLGYGVMERGESLAVVGWTPL